MSLATSAFQGAGNYGVAVLSPKSLRVKASAFLLTDSAALTAAHAVGDVGAAQPLKCGERVVYGLVTKVSEAVDLAIVEFAEPCSARVSALAVTDPAEGSPLTLVGWPGGMFKMLTGGVVSSYSVVQTENMPRYALLTDAAVYPGNSGGAAFDDSGHVVGVVTGRVCLESEDSPAQCYGSLVPISLVRLFLSI
jgi:S1-C subfamily serine protease